jgi:monoamine oxidase
MPMPGTGIDRRSLVGAAAAAVGFPRVSRAAGPGDTDVVIVGAGAAGLAAARLLQARGIGFELVEIRTRIGGRARTDTSYFGVPVDFGCAELHQGNVNPWLGYARASGFEVVRLPSGGAIFDGSVELGPAEAQAVSLEVERRHNAMRRLCLARQDVSVAAAMPADRSGRWDPSIRLWLGPVSAGVDLEDWSLLDWCEARGGDNWHARAGFGAIIAHFGRGLPVRLDTRVREIAWSGRSVSVETDRGRIRAKAAIVTLPVGVLKDGAVKFTPELPDWKTRSLDGLAIAHYIRVLLKFRDDVFGRPNGSWVAHRVGSAEGFSFWINPGGHGVTHAVAGGRFAVDLELAGADEAVDLAVSILRRMFGSKIDRAFEEGTSTVWTQDPFARGAWTEVGPGHFGAREALLTPFGGRVFFASEACHRRMPGTAGGAALIGDAVARRVAEVIARP